jgi:hypothetical protein
VATGEQPVVVAADVSRNGAPNPSNPGCSNTTPEYGDASTSLKTTLVSLSEEPSLQTAAPTVAWRSSAVSLATASSSFTAVSGLLDSFCLSSRI